MKREGSSRIIAALREVLRGRLYFSEAVAEQVTGKFIGIRAEPEGSPIDRLSDRELEIFRRIGQGQENRAIAEELNLSLKTVQTHCAHIKEKLDLPNATILIREAVRWVESEKR
jgi:DNA-binding NarL/FixJ family response regulator